jgi:uncharacterized membrane protein YqjE
MSDQDPNLDERSVGELVQRASRQAAELVRQELRLAQAELAEKGKRAGVGAGLVGAGGLVALYGLATLIAAVVMLLATQIEPWLAALIIAVVLIAIAAVLGVIGKRQAEQAMPPVPEEARESVEEDVDYLKERAQR